MGDSTAAIRLLSQSEALMNPEAMLLIDDHQPQLSKLHLRLEQRVSADQHRGTTATHVLQCRTPLLGAKGPGQPDHTDAERRQPGRQIALVLFA
jgi:hypothetical protein